MRPILLSLLLTAPLFADVTGWLDWRGPVQTGASLEKGLPTQLDPAKPLWVYEVQGAGTPVIADGLLYAYGYYGEKGEGTQEALICLDAVTGEKKWEERFSDYISDTVYNRYAIGAPTVDAETGNVYLQTANGRCVGFTRDGKKLWEISLIEDYGRLTFPNGRTGAPAVFNHLVIFHCVTANWGATGPAADRFYAFDKLTGQLVWTSTPGVVPVDSSFGMPVFGKIEGHDVFYAGTGCGHVVCIDANLGTPLWRFHLSQGGVNGQILIAAPDRLIAAHGVENTDASTSGRMVSLKIPTTYPKDTKEILVLDKAAEAWRNDDITAFTSSPVLADGKVYCTINTGELLCVDATSGKTLWREKLGPDQIHASPTYGDGKLYVPIFDGTFAIVDPSKDSGRVLSKFKLEENLLGAPAIWAGKVYLFSKTAIHCWGDKDGKFVGAPAAAPVTPGEITQLQVVPNEFFLTRGASQDFKVYGLDALGHRVKEVTPEKWEAFIPPTALVKSTVDATFKGSTLTAGPQAKFSAGAFKATVGKLGATTRGRIIASAPYAEDFESFVLDQAAPDGEKVTFPPLPWLGARLKWYVLEKDGSKVLANRLDNILFQRTMNFFGSTAMHDYVLEGDVMTDGTRRIMSSVGFINQRYLIALIGNAQVLEVSSNHERVKQSVKFPVKPNTWYSLKTRVKANPDGTGTVFAKAWPRADKEPEAWTIEVPLTKAHPNGAPGVFAFSPQSQKRVYIDNLKISAVKE